MSDEDKSLDLTGMGKLAKAIPASAWNKLVKTTCETFTQLLSPITSATTGLGRLIQAKFDGMVDAQKVLAADAVKKATDKVANTGKKPKGNPKSLIMIRAIESASNETDPNLREIWSNLMANEIIDNQVHPEFPKLLERLSSNDAVTLAEIADECKKDSVKKATLSIVYGLRIMGVSFSALVEEAGDFSREHLQNLSLIKKTSGQWRLTLFGEEFLKAVADPAFEYIQAEPLNSADAKGRAAD
jgi:hypothetical protein